MSIDDLAREASRDLRDATRLDVGTAWNELGRVARSRRRARAAGAVVVAALVVAAALGIRLVDPTDSRAVSPAGNPPSSGLPAPTGRDCQNTQISCGPDRTATIALRVPLHWTVPPGFHFPASGNGPTPLTVESYRDDGTEGVSVVEAAQAATAESVARPVLGVTSARSLARWISQRPFLASSPVREERLDGRRAWVVDVRLRPGAGPGPATCTAGIPCHPVLLAEGDVWGAWRGIESRYTVVDLPGAGTTVVWSWNLTGHAPGPTADELVGSIGFG
ncbi:hypothetical protein [Nocardioides taihuensis]|uniref:Uncharacterized protein n=1 Tax=Nocardioides taihuensis TaxID=1835606 RepID=A0ABW0BG44_9ACTN